MSLAAHPWDSHGKPPPLGSEYNPPPDDGPPVPFTDKRGRTLTREQAERVAVNCILDQHEARPYVESAVGMLSDDEVMEWCIYPDTGEFDDADYERVTR
jgi:hypothetical protein